MVCDSNQKSVTNADLTVNGKKIELSSFVENFISQTVIGMVKSLRGVDNIETIDLKISKKAKSSQAQ
jgi:hypothetical protein